VHTPHDRLFHHVFSDRSQAAGELRSMLPAELRAELSRRIDWRTLRTVSGTFVDEALTERRSDLLFTARLGDGEILLYLLLEHQSTADELMPLRLLRYMVRIWDEYLQNHSGVKRLPPIVPLAVHHSQQGWRAARSFREIVDLTGNAPEAIWRHLPHFELLIDDLSAERDEALRQRVLLPALARLTLLCLKWASQEDDVVEGLRRSAELVREVAHARNGVAALASVVRYLLEVPSKKRESAHCPRQASRWRAS